MALIIVKKPQPMLKIKSFTREEWYDVDPLAGVCKCKKFEKTKTCKHLDALGINAKKPFTPKVNPSYSQALCALVKSIRIRRPAEAVYWMMYMDGLPFKLDSQHRFRMARRLLIGSAEDGVSIPVMEKCVQNFPKLCKQDTDLLYLVAEMLRICKLPNWWHPESGGPKYVYDSLMGSRFLLYQKWDKKKQTAIDRFVAACEQYKAHEAMAWVNAFWYLGPKEPKFGATEQANLLQDMAMKMGHEQAARLCQVHLQQKGPLAGDNNFLSQAAWLMAGGQFPTAEKIEPVTAGECYALIEEAKEAWKTPHVVPSWACDGVHCAGNDTRFMGMFPQMYAVCKAYEHYGRIDPEDEWLPEFRCWDGLQVEVVS